MDEETADRPEVPGHRLLTVVGAGATSVVWSGVDAAGRPCAVKVPRARPDDATARSLQIERHVLMAVRHDHLVPLRDLVTLEDGRVALVFDHVVGATLASLVARRGHLRPGEVVTVLTPIAEAVAALHAAGGTHCDISPGNVMVTATGRPLLMDLGAARLAGSGGGLVVGTPGFVAPEVRSGESPSEASDVFSIGALAWFCCTGNGAPDTFIRLSDETIVSHVGPELAGVVARCIDPEPDRRPRSAGLADLLYRSVPAEEVEVVVGADDAAALTHRLRAEAAEGTPAGAAQPTPWFRRVALDSARWRPRLTVAAGVLALAVALGWVVHLGIVRGVPPTAARPATASAPASAPTSTTPAAPDALAILQHLTDQRVAALTARRTDALATVHRAESPSWQSDATVIRDLTKDDQRYSGLRMTVVQAEFVSRAGSVAVVRARVDVSAYDVVDERGATTSRPAEAGVPLDFHLVRPAGDTAGNWRIESISDPRPT